MSYSESENVVLTTKEEKAKYDESLKQLFSDKNLLAHILKSFVSEFEEYEIDEIVENGLKDSDISVSKTGVPKNTTNVIEGLQNEDKSNNEGNITFDIIFKAKLPGKDDVVDVEAAGEANDSSNFDVEKKPEIGMYINVEIQGKDDPGYPLESRGVFYAARRLSSQLKKIDRNTNYGALQKVYSIWIVMGEVANYRAGNVALISLKKSDIIGKTEINPAVYDLLSVVMVRINDKMETDVPILKIQQTACSKGLKPQERLKRLRNEGVDLGSSAKEALKEMCNASDYIERSSRQEGEINGEAKGIIKGEVRICRAFVASGKLSMDDALSQLNMSEEEFLSFPI